MFAHESHIPLIPFFGQMFVFKINKTHSSRNHNKREKNRAVSIHHSLYNKIWFSGFLDKCVILNIFFFGFSALCVHCSHAQVHDQRNLSGIVKVIFYFIFGVYIIAMLSLDGPGCDINLPNIPLFHPLNTICTNYGIFVRVSCMWTCNMQYAHEISVYGIWMYLFLTIRHSEGTGTFQIKTEGITCMSWNIEFGLNQWGIAQPKEISSALKNILNAYILFIR